MNYRERTKERKLKQKLIKTYDLFKIKSLNLDFSSKITLMWIIVLLISLFSPWLYKDNQNVIWNSFSNIWWNLWYINLLLIFMILFIIFFNNTWEKLKLASNLNFKNYIIFLFSSVFIIATGIVYISFIKWLNIFFEDIQIWEGIILYLLWWIVIFIWWLLKRKTYYNNEYETYINETQNKEFNKNDKSNMKLPF